MYGFSESGDSWFHKYNNFQTKNPFLKQTDGDMSFYYNNEPKCKDLLAVHVDYTAAPGTKPLKKMTYPIQCVMSLF